MKKADYPGLSLRINAAMIDSLIMGIYLYLSAYISYDIFPDHLIPRLIIIFVPFLSYEPILLYFTGSTIGHRMNKISVTHYYENKKLNLFQCYMRFITKILLGIFSLIIMFMTQKNQSFHDLITNSLVVFEKNKP